MRLTLQVLLLLSSFFSTAQSFRPIPGKIEAESYDAFHNIDTENTSDDGGGRNVGWIVDGSWMDYHLHVPAAGYYTIRFRIANAYETLASLSVKNGSGTTLAQMSVPVTGGYQVWKTESMIVPLQAGDQTVRIFAEKGGFNFNWFEAFAPKPLTGIIQAEHYDAMHEVSTETTADLGDGINVGYIDDGDWMDYNVNVPSDGTYTFKFRVAASYGEGQIQIKNTSGIVIGQTDVPITGGWQNWTTIFATANLTAGSQVIRVHANRGTFNFNWFEAILNTTTTLAGTTLPGKVEAENFDNMHNVITEAAFDTDGGALVGRISDGSWTDYRVNLANAGFYTFKIRLANGYSPEATLAIKNQSGVTLGSTVVPQTGGMQGWKTVNMIVYLPGGNQTLRLFAEKGGFNFNWFEVAASRSIAGKIEGESFDVASQVKTDVTSDIGGGTAVVYIEDGDYMDYNVVIPTAGTYAFDFRISNSYGNGKIEITNTGTSVFGSIDVPQTGGWQNWATISTIATLPAGSQILRIYANPGAFNLNWFEIAPSTLKSPSAISFAALATKTLGDSTFNLIATSNNTETPITFTSSNPTVVSVSDTSGVWKATIHALGVTDITASQAGNSNFLAATAVTRTQTIIDSAAPVQPDSSIKIPIDPTRWYQLTNAANGLDALFDGDTQTEVHTGWGKVIDQYEAYYPLKEGEQFTINSIKFFDFTGSTVDNPMVISIIDDQWQRIPIATFTGDVYNGWVGPYPDRHLTGASQFNLDTPVSNARYLIMSMPHILPTEIEFYGTYQPATATVGTPRAKNIKLKDMLGVNAYEWNFQDGHNIGSLVPAKMTAATSFSGIRHYMDWEKLEANEGVYSFNPTLSGGWNYDLIYQSLKAANMEVLACLKTLPNWMLSSYPENERDSENVPVRYGKNFADPLSYLEQARVAFQYAARYGSNPNVNPALLSVSTTPRWFGDSVNTIKIGLDLIKYIECDNERDKWWKGRKGYQTAREYAANLSAFYDGHKNTMGPAIGIKNADPNMKVVIAGLVTGPDYVKGMVDWCKEFRGYNPDGSVNLCWDVVNFHLYTDTGNSSQSGTSTRGAAPEMTNAADILENFVNVARELSNDLPVWNTEAGFDINQSSPLKAIPIGNKTAMQTQADWNLRTSLFSARAGIEKLFFYQLYDDNPLGGMFGSSGFVNDDQTRRPSADYFLQVKNQFGEYVYKETIYSDPIVDRYEHNGKSLYILTVPDEVGRTETYNLNLGQAGIAKIYTPQAGSDTMSLLELPIVDGSVTVTAGETPIFVIADLPANARVEATTASPLTKASERNYTHTLNVYPNPSHDYVMIDMSDFEDGNMVVNLFDARLGRLHKQEKISKSSYDATKKLTISTLPAGTYILEIKQAHTSTFHKIVKGI
jgi:endoglucanase